MRVAKQHFKKRTSGNTLPRVSSILSSIIRARNPLNVFLKECDKIAQMAAQGTNSQMGILYLTADQKILEAVGRYGELIRQVLPEDIPFYRLDWDIVPGYEYMYDGFTAWLAVHLRPHCYDVRVMEPCLEAHPAHKGQWDPIVWQAEASRYLDRILSVSIGKEYPNSGEYRCIGLLKVERKMPENRTGKPFEKSEILYLQDLGNSICNWFDNEKNADAFWRIQAQVMAGRKAAQFLRLFARGRSVAYNITEGIGFITEFLRILLGARHAFHVFHGEKSPTQVRQYAAVMPYWRPAYRSAVWKVDRDQKDMLVSHSLGQPEQDVPWRTESVRPRLLRKGDLDRKRDSMDHFVLVMEQIGRSSYASGWNDLLERIEAIWNQSSEKRGTVADVKASDLDIEVSLPDPGGQWAVRSRISGAKLVRLLSSERDLGTIVIPNSLSHQGTNIPRSTIRNPEIAGIASTLARTFDALLSSQYDLPIRLAGISRFPSIYLPRLRAVGNKWISVLFADIRGFSRLTQMLRLLEEKGALELLMDFYALQMAEIISFWGRRDKFMGDGLLALFGEELFERPNENELKVIHAICCACQMVLVFHEIKLMWGYGNLNEQLLPWRCPAPRKGRSFNWTRIQREFSEEVDFDNVRLAIGINFGNPYFDYFGDTKRREYTPVGDQINLAKRLEEEASRFDKQLGRVRAPILISQTVWSYAWDNGQGILLRPHGGWSPLHIPFHGLAFEYPSYEIWPDLLNLDRIRQIIRESEGNERADQLPFEKQSDGTVTLSKEYLEKIRQLWRQQD